MNDDRVLFRSQPLGAVPYFFNERAGGVVLTYFHAFALQESLCFQRSAESWDNYYVIGSYLIPGNKLLSICIRDERDPAVLEIAIHFLVVDHLAEKKHPLPLILLQRPVADFNGILYSVAKAEMACQVKNNRSEVKYCWGKILFARVIRPADFLDPAG